MRRRAFSLPELAVSAGLFSLFLLVGYGALTMAERTFHQISGNEDSTMQLKRACRMIQQDLAVSNVLNVTVVNVPASLPGGAFDSSAICMLSCADQGTGDMVTKPTGEPFWQRNILYYCICPLGDPCQGGADAKGFDDRCPHKALIRKIIDNPPATAKTDTPQNDEMNANPSGFLTRPAGPTNIANLLGETNVTQVELVGRRMISLQTQVTPNPNYPNEVTVHISTLNEKRGSKLAIGTVALTGKPGYLVNDFSAFPRNNR